VSSERPLLAEIFSTPLGWVGLVVGPRGLERVWLPRHRSALLREMRSAFPQLTLLDEPDATRPWRQGILEMMKGRPPSFPDHLNWDKLSTFTRAVLVAVRSIPWGTVMTYGQLAVAVGRPRAARAVGRAVAANPWPLVVPCHRVVRADGIGGFGGGVELKRTLLQKEGIWR